MNRVNRAWKAVILMAGLWVSYASCSPIHRLEATYRLPPAEGALTGKQSFVSVEDLRKDKRTLGDVAALRFMDSGGVISLSVARGTGPGVIRGIYQPPALLREAMENRLKHEGIQVVPDGAASTGLSVLLKSFFLDRAARKWVMVITYEARLVRDGKVLSSQTVTGEAERLDILGSSQADVVLSELLTDVVNRLELRKLFQDSGL